MSTQILDRITADPDQQERYARIALACLTIPGEPNPPAVRLTGTNGPAVVQHTLDTLPPAIAEQTVIDALDSAADGTHRVLIPTDPEWPTGLDDLGTEPMIPSITFEALFAVLNERGNAGRATALATNLGKAEILESYGERIFSRLFSQKGYSVIELRGNDLRIG